jgi:hypothetical protein
MRGAGDRSPCKQRRQRGQAQFIIAQLRCRQQRRLRPGGVCAGAAGGLSGLDHALAMGVADLHLALQDLGGRDITIGRH